MNDVEKWASVPFATDYEASSLGRVRRVSGRQQAYHGLIMSQKTYGLGYKAVSLYYEGRQHTHGVHRVVCAAFHGLPQPGQEACHLDGSKDNNIPENLVWRDHIQNCADKKAHGTHQVGVKNPSAKLTPEQVKIIRSAEPEGAFRRRLADQFGVSVSTISQIRSGAVWL